MDDQLQMFKELLEAPGAPGYERPVRDVMRRYLEPLGELSGDNLGSIICRKSGQADGPRIAISGHLDEIGFMVTRITDEGFIKFQTLGGWWEQVMLAQRVAVQTRNGPIIGLIGSKPPHILPAEERNKVVDRKTMFVDVGAASKAEAESWGIRPGDAIVPVGDLQPMHNPKLLMGKAWDNRFGCALVIDLLRALQNGTHPNVVYGVATVQEEVGLRGATTATHVIAPEIGFAIDTGIAGDMPGLSADDAVGKLGKGPVLLIQDGSMIPHLGLRDLVLDTAAAENIPLQIDKMPGGGTDAGKMHVFGAGVPSLVVGVPVRYIHTNYSILHRDDYDACVQLMAAVIRRLDADTVRELKRYA